MIFVFFLFNWSMLFVFVICVLNDYLITYIGATRGAPCTGCACSPRTKTNFFRRNL